MSLTLCIWCCSPLPYLQVKFSSITSNFIWHFKLLNVDQHFLFLSGCQPSGWAALSIVLYHLSLSWFSLVGSRFSPCLRQEFVYNTVEYGNRNVRNQFQFTGQRIFWRRTRCPNDIEFRSQSISSDVPSVSLVPLFTTLTPHFYLEISVFAPAL